MHTRASNSELVEPLPEPERILNRRRRRRNRRVPFDQRNNPPKYPRIVYPPILNINRFRHFLDTLENLFPMDDEPMWVADRVVAPTPSSANTIPETANEFAIKGNHLTLVKGNQFDGRTKTDPHKHIHESLGICDMFKYRDSKNKAVRLMMFPLSLTEEAKTWLDEFNEGTIETWDELRTAFISRFFPPALFERISNRCLASEITQEVLNAAAGGIFLYKTPNQAYQLLEDKQSTNAFVKETFMDLKTQLKTVAKNHQASIQNLETMFDRLADKQSGRPSGSLPSNTQPNPKGHNSKAYQPPQSRNEPVNAVFTRSGKFYNSPVNLNDQQTNSETPINFDSDDEDEEPTPQPKTQNPKPVKETPLPKPYKPKIPYPQRLRKEKMEAQYGKFLDMICTVRINVPLIDVLAGMPNYGKFLKELISNKHNIEQISAAFLSDESSAMIQNKVPPKLGDPGSFLIPCNFNKTFSCNALADIGASINIMPYSLYAKLSLENLKPTKMSLNLGVGTERMIFNIYYTMKHSYSNDDTYFSIDVIDEILEEDFDALLDKGSKILHSIEGTLLEEEIFAEFDEFMAMTADENSDSESDEDSRRSP
ncbi:reverse transcriptase domain-containing protein [Tanacetum coccineum]